MPSVVVDASAVVELVLRGERATRLEQVLAGSDMAAPDLVNAEVLSAIRRLESLGQLSPPRAEQAVLRLVEAPLRRVATVGLVAMAWSLRPNLTAYDALYVSLARALGCPLVTGDRRLAQAPDAGVTVVMA